MVHSPIPTGTRDRSAPSTRITVDNAAAGTRISRDLWGIFFEDINYSADGGLYGELVQNRSFDYTDRDQPGWHALTGWLTPTPTTGAQPAPVRIETTRPLHPNTTHHAVLDASTRSEGVALINEGFDGIPLAHGGSYRFSVFARVPGDAPADLRVELVDDEGTVAAAEIVVADAAWTAYEAILTVQRTSGRARLRLSIQPPAVLALTFVSLFPTATYAARRNGMRRDLAEAIAALKPRFVRFPGGCVAHGLGLENLYRWKDTVGEPPARRPDFNIWGYHQSMGLGYYEYFEFCEQIGAKPLPVLAAAVCCQNTPGGPQAIPLTDLDHYIQDVLDLVEFANGPADSTWGAVRTQAGHPEPFGLQYLAIGNEDRQDPVFRDRFERIYRAVRAKHPQLTLIGTAGPYPFGRDYEDGWQFARELGIDLVDEHSYKAPKWLFENLERFDTYDRSGPGVYLGEYGSKGNTMLNALAEAAYMMGLERNGDVVRLASYAPLLAKADRTQWVPDLIYFDNERVLPTLNYHVQQMHANASGDHALPVTVADPPHFVRAPQQKTNIEIYTESAELTIRDLRLNESEPIDAQLTADRRSVRPPHQTTAADYTITLRVRQTSGDEGFALAFGDLDSGYCFEWHFGTWKNRYLTLYYKADGHLDELVEPISFSVEQGREYDVEIRVQDRGQRITCLLDGTTVHETIDPEQRFTATAVHDNDTGTLHVKIVNATPEPVHATLDLTEEINAHTTASRTSLTAPADAGAPFEPAPTAPITSQIDVREPLSLQPYSFTIVSLAPAPPHSPA